MSKKEDLTKREQEESNSVELSFLSKFITSFDGTREKLNPFITNCKNALSLAEPWQKNMLFMLILSKLEGKAQSACSIKEFDDWSQLEDFLKTQFGEKKHYAHLLAELQDCKQLSNESVNQFGLRLETCLARLKTEINLSMPSKRKTELAGRVAAMEDLALHNFVTGLNPKIATTVRCRNPENLNAAINFAVNEEKVLESMFKKMTLSSPNNNNLNRNRNTQPRPSTNSNNNYGGNKLFCRYCKNPGHVIENCRKREFNNNRFKNFDRQQPSGSNQKSPQKQYPRINFVSETVDEEACNDSSYMIQDPNDQGYDTVDAEQKNE